MDIDIDVDNSKEFVANVDSGLYLGQLCISKPDFQPYNYVEFTIVDIRQDVGKVPVFWYGDKAGDTVQEIIENLNRALRVLLEE